MSRLAQGLRGIPLHRPSPQEVERLRRRHLFDEILGPRAALLAPQGRRTYVLTNRPSVAPRLEDVRNPDDRALRRSLVARAQAFTGQGRR